MSGASRSPGRIGPEYCACGRMAAGYDAVREEPVCPVCAASLGGDGA